MVCNLIDLSCFLFSQDCHILVHDIHKLTPSFRPRHIKDVILILDAIGKAFPGTGKPVTVTIGLDLYEIPVSPLLEYCQNAGLGYSHTVLYCAIHLS